MDARRVAARFCSMSWQPIGPNGENKRDDTPQRLAVINQRARCVDGASTRSHMGSDQPSDADPRATRDQVLGPAAAMRRAI